MASSSVVLLEPAPFDFGFIAMFGLALLFGLRVPRDTMGFVVIASLFLLFSLIGTSQSPATEYFNDTVRHMMITGLLVGVALFIVCFVYRFQDRAVTALMNGWVAAALVASLAGIAGYFGLAGGASEEFTLYGRARGTFKDPNVFAPFLVPPALYCIYHAATRSWFWAAVNLGALLIIAIGLFLSFSRGGWGHMVFSGFVAVVAWMCLVNDNRFKLRLITFMALGGAVLVVALLSVLDLEGVGDLFADRFRFQSYDSSGHGRFAGQYLTFLKIQDFPLGLGAHGFLPDWYEQPHNVYLFMFIIGGWGGGFSYFLLVGMTLGKAIAFLKRSNRHTGIMIILLASFSGLALEGMIVDSDHWRHFWILTGAIWGVSAIHANVPRRASHPVPVETPMPARLQVQKPAPAPVPTPLPMATDLPVAASQPSGTAVLRGPMS